MKMLNKTVSAALVMTALLAMAGCSSSSDDGGSGGSGGSPLAVGSFEAQLSESTPTGYSSMFSSSNYSRFQNLYLASETDGSGYITAIKYYYNADEAVDVTCPAVTIKMGHTKVATLGNKFSDNVETSAGAFETVLSGATVVFPQGSAGESHTITLDTPFYYDGANNLIIDVENNSSCSGTFNARSTGSLAYTANGYTHQRGNDNMLTGSYHPDVTAVFKGGADTARASDSTHDNSNTIAPGRTGRTQAIIRAQDINGKGAITGIAFRANTTTSATEMNISISMMHTSLNNLVTSFETNIDSSSTPVKVAELVSFKVPAGQEYFWIPMNKPFKYDGSSNLLLDISAEVSLGSFPLDYKNVPTVRVVTSVAVDNIDGNLFARSFEPKFRFNGATMDVITAGTAMDNYPFNSSVNPKFNYLFRSSELGTSGKINSLFVRLNNDSQAGSYPNFKVVLGHTERNELTAVFADNMDDAREVYKGTYSIPAGLKAGDWLEVKFDRSFTYNGAKNLVVQMESDAGDHIQSLVGNSITDNRHAYAADRTAITADGVNSFSLDLRLKLK